MSARRDALAPMPVEVRSTEHDDGLTHITELRDEDRSLCGIDLTGCEWDLDDDGPLCVVCEDLEAPLLAWGVQP